MITIMTLREEGGRILRKRERGGGREGKREEGGKEEGRAIRKSCDSLIF